VAGWYWLNKSSGSIIKSFRDMGVKNRNHPSELELAEVPEPPIEPTAIRMILFGPFSPGQFGA
jgi:hypothetical protein